MRRSAALVSTGLIIIGAGCSSSYPVRNRETPANVTLPQAMGNYQRVYNTTYHIVNRYAVVKKASYRSGEIEGEVGEDNQLFDRTRKTILCRIFEAGEHYEVDCKVLYKVEQSEVETFGEFQPREEWRVVANDPFLESKLSNEIKRALTGGAFESKVPLQPEDAAPEVPAKPKIRIAPSAEPAPSAPHEGASDKSEKKLREARAVPSGPEERTEQECERIGLKLMEKGVYAKAADAFREASERKSATAPYLLAQALFATGDYKGSAAAIREGAARNPEWARTRLDLRGFYGDETELREHVLALEKHQQAHQDDRDAALVMGYVAYMTGDYKRAATAFHLLPKDDQVAETYRRFTAVELDRARGLEEF